MRGKGRQLDERGPRVMAEGLSLFGAPLLLSLQLSMSPFSSQSRVVLPCSLPPPPTRKSAGLSSVRKMVYLQRDVKKVVFMAWTVKVFL